jgi:hypothetical protein
VAGAVLGLAEVARPDAADVPLAAVGALVGADSAGVGAAGDVFSPGALGVGLGGVGGLGSADARAGALDSELARTAIEGVWRLAKYTEEDAPVKVWFGGYLPIEATAHTIRTWHPVIVPGLLQTEAYARALFTAMGMTPAQVEEQVELRMRRQEILARERPPDLTFVLWEPVLHHQIGTPAVMREQLAKLLELPSSIVVQVVPGDIGGNAGLGGAITLAEGQKGAVLLAEALIENQVTTDTDLVLKASATFNAVRADALPRARSRDMILEANEQWNDT